VARIGLRPEELARFSPSFGEDLLDPGDRLVDRLLGADAIGADAVNRLRPDPLLPNAAVPPVPGNIGVVVFHRARTDLHHAGASERPAADPVAQPQIPLHALEVGEQSARRQLRREPIGHEARHSVVARAPGEEDAPFVAYLPRLMGEVERVARRKLVYLRTWHIGHPDRRPRYLR
jgi:hypothetical protein